MTPRTLSSASPLGFPASRRGRRLAFLAGLLLALAHGLGAAAPQEGAPSPAGRKIYADYHNARYTREHDGALGIWKYATVGKNSRIPNPVVNRNADLVDAAGRHEIAGTYYPLVGMQSELDPDYLEYQVLSAKAAYIDGFFVEWGFPEHPSETVRRTLTAVAARYDFEIGINLCDRWLFTQLPARRPELKTREQLLGAFRKSYDYLLRTVFREPNAVRHGGRPVLLLFGDGLSTEEFSQLRRDDAREGTARPWVLVRPRISGKQTEPEGTVAFSWDKTPWYTPESGLGVGVDGFFGWVPTRARRNGPPEIHRQWDRFATLDDALLYLGMITSVHVNGPRVSSAVPGFDNRYSAGWGHDFSLLPRGDGGIYRAMWQFNQARAGEIDWVYLPTWNDWSEGSQIEPSAEDQGACLRLTEENAARFKGLPSDPALTELPRHVFACRQRVRRLERLGVAVPVSAAAALDGAAQAVARRNRHEAQVLLAQAEKAVGEAESRIPPSPTLRFAMRDGRLKRVSEEADTPGQETATALPLQLRMDDASADTLRRHTGDAVWLDFEYQPTGKGKLEVLTDTERPPTAVGNFGVVADLTLAGAGAWRSARVKVFPKNAAWRHRLEGQSDLEFRGPALVRRIRLTSEGNPANPRLKP